jgi:hypothetical protein
VKNFGAVCESKKGVWNEEQGFGFMKLGFGPELDERWMNKVGVPKPYRLEATWTGLQR